MDLDAHQTLLPLAAARDLIVAAVIVRPAELVAVAAAVGRVPAGPLRALADLPADDNSALDGFALRAAEATAPLAIAFAIAAGDDPAALPEGMCAGIATGGVIPDGADAVVAVEDAVVADGRVLVTTAPDPGNGIRRRGADVRAGDVILGGALPLSPLAAAALVAAGHAEIACLTRPRAVVLATGDELVPPGSPLRRGLIHDSNGLLIAGTLRSFGCDVRAGGRVPDTRDETERLFAAALGADLVVSSGGVSVGPRDHVKPALRALGVEEILWRVAIQPGKPVWVGRAPSGAIVIGLPGNPLSALVGLHLLVAPLVARMLGLPEEQFPGHAVTVAVPRLRGRLRALPARLTEGGAEPLARASHQIVRAATADGLVLIAPGKGDHRAGEEAPFVPFRQASAAAPPAA